LLRLRRALALLLPRAEKITSSRLNVCRTRAAMPSGSANDKIASAPCCSTLVATNAPPIEFEIAEASARGMRTMKREPSREAM
jgi:hypothetical protein